jgi:carboxymethylenebutenolidase
VRASLCLAAACLAFAGCEPPPPNETAASSQDAPVSASIADPVAVPADPNVETPTEGDANPLVALLEQDLPYGEGADGNFVGFLAVPADAAEPLPGVIVLHEWWGLTPEIREAARRIAREGYIVLAVDLYGGRTASAVPEAQTLLRGLVDDPDRVRNNIRQAYEYLERYALAPRIGSIGWDLGGRWSLQTALMMPDKLDAAVVIYGSVETDETVLDTLEMPILGLFGEQDRSIPVRDVQEFRAALARLGKPAEVRIYSGVDHDFFFPGTPNYSPIAADDAWLRSLMLLESALKN